MTHVLSSSLLILPGADEDGESPELTTSRPTPKIPFTSSAPRVETTTLSKIQDKIAAQTKVCFISHRVIGLLSMCLLKKLYRMFLLRGTF